jgi:hypothetical protein
MELSLQRYDYPPRRIWGSLQEVRGYAQAVADLDPIGAVGLPISGDDIARFKVDHRA